MSLVTVTANPALDRLYVVPGFAPDGVFRAKETRVLVGGKGINVARVFQTLGGEVTATGFLGGTSGEQIRQRIDREGIPVAFAPIAGESRVCLAVLDPAARTDTVINEAGPTVSADECEALVSRLRELLPGADTVVLSGSLPPGVPADFYGRIIRMARDEYGVRSALDAGGEVLAHGADARPFLLKPNGTELAALEVGGDGWGESADRLRRKFGAAFGIVTGGPRGAVAASAEGVWEAVPPPVEIVSAVGSGDSLLAAFLWALEQGGDAAEALRLGAAAGAANATVYGSGFCSHEMIFDLASRTDVNKIA